MTIVRVGTTKKYADGWETAFGKGKRKVGPAAKKAAAKKAAKKSAKPAAKKRSPAKAKKK
ncbi:MAG: hypothetical protein WD063_13995 [Pirellulales bacterium]